MPTKYSPNFYSDLEKTSLRSAEVLIPILVDRFLPSSVIDFGCGSGAFVKQFLLSKVHEVIGVEGEWISEVSHLSQEKWLKIHDLKTPIHFGRKFDLAVCLEVAEHLPAANSRTLIETLINASDRVVFSAAIPGQGGTDHINLQYPDYWAELFQEHGYFLEWDPRPSIWNNNKVAPWYKQNLLVFCKHSMENVEFIYPQRMFHPEIFPEYASIFLKTKNYMRKVISQVPKNLRIKSKRE